MSSWNEAAWFAAAAGVALKSAAVLAMTWLAAALLCRRSAAVRHLLWTAAAAAVLALPWLSISLPALPVAGFGMPPIAARFVIDAAGAAPGAAAAPAAAARSLDGRAAAKGAPWIAHWRSWLLLVWFCGSLAAALQMLLAWRRLRCVRNEARPWPDRALCLELARALRAGDGVRVLETQATAMPMTFGLLRPAVLMPAAAAGWSEERRRVVLLHELAHLRRGDTATHLLARLALILHWWNPLAWKAWKEFLKERECATDDVVLQSGARASDYAGHLLGVARGMQNERLGWAAVAMARRSQLEGRLTAILDTGVARGSAGRAALAAALIAAVVLVAPLAALHAQENQPAVPADVDATLRAAAAQKNHEILDKAAAAFEQLRQYDTARKLLDAAAQIREETAGAQSVDYGVGLLRIAQLEQRRNPRQAEDFYRKALAVLGDRPEAAPALLNLGMHSKNVLEALDYLQRAERLDPALAGRARMWMALVQERQQNMAEAEALYQAALAVEDPQSADAADTMRLYARMLKRLGREEEAKDLLERAAQAQAEGNVVRAPAGGGVFRAGGGPVARAPLSQAQPAQNVYRVGAGIAPPKLLSKVEPQYTEEARAAGYEGTSVLYIEVAPDGLAHNLRVVKGIGMGLDEKAMEAIGQWRFSPGTKDGTPVTVAATVEVNFRLM